MQSRIVEHDDDEGPLLEEEFDEGLDSDYEEDDYDEEGAEELEETDDDDEEGYIRGLGPLPGPGPAGLGQSLPRRQGEDESKPWQGLGKFPAATMSKYVQLLNNFRSQNKQQLSILLLGKHFVGKSFTVNSLLNEEAAKRQFLNRDIVPPLAHSREAHGFVFTIIDTPGLAEMDLATSTAMIKEFIEDRSTGGTIDVVLYVDRFDVYRMDGSDEQAIKSISELFGSWIWNNTVLGLTFAGETVNGYSWEEFAEKRSDSLRRAIRKHGRNAQAELPVAFIENSDNCEQNEDGEKVLPDGAAWLPTLMQKVADKATSAPAYKYDSQAIRKATNPNSQRRWLIPLLFAAQVAFKFLVFDRLIEDDYITGDRHGPYKQSEVNAERRRRALEKKFKASKGRGAVAYYDDDDSDSDSD